MVLNALYMVFVCAMGFGFGMAVGAIIDIFPDREPHHETV
jgi:hypothetical protein